MFKKSLITLSAFVVLANTNLCASEIYGWNPEIGKKLYISKIKKQMCKKLHVKKFTQVHTQKEWKQHIDNGSFVTELKEICKDFDEKALTNRQLANLGDAVINYASDSYNIPS
jgi:hypothetical protein